jgi:HK97 family phage portal protein
MALLARIFGRSAEQRALPAPGMDPLPPAFSLFGAGPTGYADAGVTVTEANAVISSAVWGCIATISQTIAALPAHVLTRKGGEKLYEHPVAKLLASSPNPFMTPAVFREALLSNALLWGAGFAAIERDELGVPTGLYPLRSAGVQPMRQAGQLLYRVSLGTAVHTLTPADVLVVLGWTHDGISPVSPVRAGSQQIGLDVAMNRYAAKAFSGGNVGGILQTPAMNKDAMQRFVESWRANYTGIENAFRVAVLPDPMKFVPTTLKPQEGQMVEARNAIVLDIARFFRVPPWMLGILEKSSYASLEAQSAAFHQMTISPWVIKLEQEAAAKLLLEREKPELEVRFNLDSLLRATTQERYTAYQTGRQGGWLSINDIRRKEGLPPIEGGDSYLSPLNMTPVGGAAASTSPATPPADTTTK